MFKRKSFLKGDLRPKLHLSFYDTFLLVLWKKGLVQMFVMFWPVYTNL